ncbi:hypothetical protein VTN02DRAFT_4367 [Thermoascus thermophilus]
MSRQSLQAGAGAANENGDMSGVASGGSAPATPASQRPSTPLPSLPCSFCLEDIRDNGDIILKLCRKCHVQCCGKCIRKLFLDACKNESDMPPRCCEPIPLALGRKVLSAEEVTFFKEKYDEWSTSNRVYCPVPTCSAFIPNRLFPAPVGSIPDVKASNTSAGSLNPTVIFATGVKMEVHTPAPSPSPSSAMIPSIPCPKCSAQICCSCKQLSHPGSPCPEVQDIDPELAALLKRWGIKRCPKCRAAVRRMYGCSHIQCRCGAQWCWHCTGPIALCRDQMCPAAQESERFERQINDENDPDWRSIVEDYSTELNEDDSNTPQPADGNGAQASSPTSNPTRLVNLDAGWQWEGAEEDFGDEPNIEVLDPFDCHHAWKSVEESEIETDLEYECERCWRRVYPQSDSYRYMGVKALVENGSVAGQSAAETVAFSNDALMRRCDECGIIRCPGCSKEAMR